jgi:hypothetical protein
MYVISIKICIAIDIQYSSKKGYKKADNTVVISEKPEERVELK